MPTPTRYAHTPPPADSNQGCGYWEWVDAHTTTSGERAHTTSDDDGTETVYDDDGTILARYDSDGTILPARNR